MALLITAYLVLTNMSAPDQEFDAFTAMDAWFVACRLIVGALSWSFEFALLIKILSSSDSPRPKMQGEKYDVEDKCKLYDRRAFVIFSSSFVLFAVIYFAVCMAH